MLINNAGALLFARRFRIETAGTPAVVLGRMFGIRNAALVLGLLELESFAVIRHGYGTTGLPGGRDHLFGSVGIIWGCWAGCQLWVFGGACRTGLR